MSDKYYTVVFVYPDGHIEELEEHFENGADAREQGNSLLAQVLNTEKFHGGFTEDKRDPYFMIVEVIGKRRNLVFESNR